MPGFPGSQALDADDIHPLLGDSCDTSGSIQLKASAGPGASVSFPIHADFKGPTRQAVRLLSLSTGLGPMLTLLEPTYCLSSQVIVEQRQWPGLAGPYQVSPVCLVGMNGFRIPFM